MTKKTLIDLPLVRSGARCPYTEQELNKPAEYILELNEQEIERVCISPNSICNLRCRYCYFFNPENRITSDKELTSKEIFTILENIHRYGNGRVQKKVKVNFVGSGEPLLSWGEIEEALTKFHERYPTHELRFYMVTNGVLLTSDIIGGMIKFNLTPSISLDGPEFIHDANRIDKFGEGTFRRVIAGIELLRENGLSIIINTTMTYDLLDHIEEYFDFIQDLGVNKVIFDRLVDVPKTVPAVPYDEYYENLDKIHSFWKEKGLDIEIGNFEAYKRSINLRADRVCTMFGSTCGAGTNNIIYLQRKVYPCGRMFGDEWWVLGEYSQPLESIQSSMIQRYPKRRRECEECDVLTECIKDCLMEEISPNYDCTPRKQFLRKYKSILRTDTR